MRIAVLCVYAKDKSPALLALATQVAEGMRAKGHQVDLLNAKDDVGIRLAGYEYLAVCAEPLGPFTGKIPGRVATSLAAASSLVGKRSAAFLRKSGLFSAKAMGNLMRAMEKEGMTVNWTEFLLSADQALALGKGMEA